MWRKRHSAQCFAFSSKQWVRSGARGQTHGKPKASHAACTRALAARIGSTRRRRCAFSSFAITRNVVCARRGVERVSEAISLTCLTSASREEGKQLCYLIRLLGPCQDLLASAIRDFECIPQLTESIDAFHALLLPQGIQASDPSSRFRQAL